MQEEIEEIMAQIDDAQLAEFQKFFDSFDREKNGYIMSSQVGRILEAMGQTDYDEKTMRKTIRKFDADGSGKLEFEEFAAMVFTIVNTVDKATLEKELKEAFRLFDKEQQGFISTKTLRALLLEIDDKLTDAELDQAIDEIDADGSGKIEFEEFWELMAGESDE